MNTFTRKVLRVEAVQFIDALTLSGYPQWIGEAFIRGTAMSNGLQRTVKGLELTDASNKLYLFKTGDWIARDAAGGIHWYSKEDFAETFEVEPQLRTLGIFGEQA